MTHTHVRAKFDRLIERMAYPTDTEKIIEFIRIHGTSDDVVGVAELLPAKTYKSAAEIRQTLDAISAR